jgi:hypothetical protein
MPLAKADRPSFLVVATLGSTATTFCICMNHKPLYDQSVDPASAKSNAIVSLD